MSCGTSSRPLLVTGDETASTRRTVEISHEALIRHWGLLKEWIAANRDTLRRRERVRARMREWEEGRRNPSLLLTPGLPLGEGRRLLYEHGDVLIGDVQDYIQKSTEYFVESPTKFSDRGVVGKFLERFFGAKSITPDDRKALEIMAKVEQAKLDNIAAQGELENIMRERDKLQTRIDSIVDEIRARDKLFEQPRVFLSYPKENSEAALKIYETLTDNGCAVWMDKKSLVPGQRWREVIENRIRDSQFLLLLCSKEGLARRGFFHAEQNLAWKMQAEIPSDQLYLIPVRINECQLPPHIAELHYLDWRTEEDTKKIMYAIADGISRSQEAQREF
jgi:hypothetical protein